MRSMVRVLVGTMLEVASGRRTLEDFTALLTAPPAPPPAKPPHLTASTSSQSATTDQVRPHGLISR